MRLVMSAISASALLICSLVAQSARLGGPVDGFTSPRTLTAVCVKCQPRSPNVAAV
jgi:hypothetical protein